VKVRVAELVASWRPLEDAQPFRRPYTVAFPECVKLSQKTGPPAQDVLDVSGNRITRLMRCGQSKKLFAQLARSRALYQALSVFAPRSE
jgi:hypothetical protein